MNRLSRSLINMECNFLKLVRIMAKIYIKHFLLWLKKLNQEYLILIPNKNQKMVLVLLLTIQVKTKVKEVRDAVEQRSYIHLLDYFYFIKIN